MMGNVAMGIVGVRGLMIDNVAVDYNYIELLIWENKKLMDYGFYLTVEDSSVRIKSGEQVDIMIIYDNDIVSGKFIVTMKTVDGLDNCNLYMTSSSRVKFTNKLH